MTNKPVIAIAGATGVVGAEMVELIEELKVPFSEVRLLASAGSAGELYKVGEEDIEIQELTASSFEGVDIALFALGSDLTREFVPAAIESGARVIDNSSAFRLDDNVPLVVPEINAKTIESDTKLIANPNCSTIQLVMVLDAVASKVSLKRVVVSTYQAVSGAGKAALDELWEQSVALFNQQSFEPEAFQHQIAFNCIPQIDLMQDDGYTREETKVINESRKILALPELAITATAVRVPVFHCHAESVNIELESELSAETLIKLLDEAPGIEVYPNKEEYPMQLGKARTNDVHVGRVRRDKSVDCGYDLWIVADNLRKGAALNAVQIAKYCIDTYGK